MSNKHYVGEAGTSLRLDTGVVIGSASFQFIQYQKPSGVEGSWAGTLFSSYSALAETVGIYFVARTLITTDFDESGEWRFQAQVGAVDGTWLGETVKVEVLDTFE